MYICGGNSYFMISEPFLKEVASYLLKSGNYDLSQSCIVFPNKRARLYLSKYLGEITSKPVWAPRYITISELMELASGFMIADKITLLFELYETYLEITESSKPFDTFYPFSEALLADFDEIDKYLVDAHDLFQNLSDLKSLDGKFNYLSENQINMIQRFWSTFDEKGLSADQKSFIHLWDILDKLYPAFNKRLITQNLAYEGMAYRKAVETTGENAPLLSHIEKFVFIGFNALSNSEERLFRMLKGQNRAEFFWDYDQWYINSEIHEAGRFMRKNIRAFPEPRPANHDFLSKDKKHIFFIPVSSNTGQTVVLPALFEKMNIRSNEDAESTAVVMADEALLMPALYAIPDYITEINVTMGYPLAGSSVFSLIDHLYQLLRNSKKDETGKRLWYLRDVLAVMGNPLLSPYFGNIYNEVRDRGFREHWAYISSEQLHEPSFDSFMRSDQIEENTCSFLLNAVSSLLSLRSGHDRDEKLRDPVQSELLFQVYTYLLRLNDLLNQKKITPGAEVLFRLIRKMLKAMRLPFTGEPLAGLQMLGILETRTLDFKNVIVLSANEGTLPGSWNKPSFLPHNLRAGFGMPTSDHQDAIYAYYFYRLIQRAESVAFIYDSSTGGLRTGERSRFLHQLVYEMNLPVTELSLSTPVNRIPDQPISIKKSEEILHALSAYHTGEKKILSPSAINEFINCSLRFYFHHLLGLKEPDEYEEDVDARLFGNILHFVLKSIYESFGHKSITRESLLELLKNDALIAKTIENAFQKEFFCDSPGTSERQPEGYNRIVRQVIEIYVRQFLKAESDKTPFTIISTEEHYHIPLKIQTKDDIKEIKIGGIIDRIDLHEGKIRILDYKTGSAKNAFSSVASLFDRNEKKRNSAVFQVFLYAYVYQILHPQDVLAPGLYFIRQSYLDGFSPDIRMAKQPVQDFSSISEDFANLLIQTLEQLFNPNIPFEQTDNETLCSHCPYALICRREQSPNDF